MNSLELNQENISKILGEFIDPETGRTLQSCGQIKSVELSDNAVSIEIGLTSHSAPLKGVLEEELQAMLQHSFADAHFAITFVDHQRKPTPLGQVGLTVKSVIAVGSGKGGVGKSSISTLLALGLHKSGCKVGLLDSDVYGPSIPHLLGINGKPEGDENKKIIPLDYHGMPVMSIGFMVKPEDAVIWRGPMLHSALTTFVRDVKWGDLDYLIIDMPPGTGDIALSLSQMLPLTGSIIVCTPQDVALIDAIKAVGMMRKLKIPILGLVENMSGFVCPDNGKRYDIFGKGGAKKYAEENKIDFLGDVPIFIQVRELADQGKSLESLNDEQVRPVIDRLVESFCLSVASKARSGRPQNQHPVL